MVSLASIQVDVPRYCVVLILRQSTRGRLLVDQRSAPPLQFVPSCDAELGSYVIAQVGAAMLGVHFYVLSSPFVHLSNYFLNHHEYHFEHSYSWCAPPPTVCEVSLIFLAMQ